MRSRDSVPMAASISANLATSSDDGFFIRRSDISTIPKMLKCVKDTQNRVTTVRYEQELINIEVAKQLDDLRTKAGLSQRELARKVGTTASAICRLEDADYKGHSLTMLRRIAEALDKRV